MIMRSHDQKEVNLIIPYKSLDQMDLTQSY